MSDAPADRPLRVLLIAEAANPEWTSVPLVGWSHAKAIRERCDAHIVTQIRNKPAFERAGVDPAIYTAIDNEHIAGRAFRIAQKLGLSKGKAWTIASALGTVAYWEFERLLWNRFGGAITRGEYDVVHRLTPLSPSTPSPLAAKCARAGVPFVMGPINGGVPWPQHYRHLQRREGEWASVLRPLGRWIPGYTSTRRHASAIIVASRSAADELAEPYRGKQVYMPENAIDPARFPPPPSRDRIELPLRVAFVGRLVPCKAVDLLLEAVAPFARDGRLTIDIIGDGPERDRIERTIRQECIESAVTMPGWIDHHKLHERLGGAHVLGFPSVRDFGGGVVLEAMALGVVPLVADYAGPAELVTDATGFKIPLGTPAQLVARVRESFAEILDAPECLLPMARAARRRVEALFTWDARAAQSVRVYEWVTGRAPKPDFGMPFPDTETHFPIHRDTDQAVHDAVPEAVIDPP